MAEEVKEKKDKWQKKYNPDKKKKVRPAKRKGKGGDTERCNCPSQETLWRHFIFLQSFLGKEDWVFQASKSIFWWVQQDLGCSHWQCAVKADAGHPSYSAWRGSCDDGKECMLQQYYFFCLFLQLSDNHQENSSWSVGKWKCKGWAVVSEIGPRRLAGRQCWFDLYQWRPQQDQGHHRRQ